MIFMKTKTQNIKYFTIIVSLLIFDYKFTKLLVLSVIINDASNQHVSNLLKPLCGSLGCDELKSIIYHFYHI